MLEQRPENQDFKAPSVNPGLPPEAASPSFIQPNHPPQPYSVAQLTHWAGLLEQAGDWELAATLYRHLTVQAPHHPAPNASVALPTDHAGSLQGWLGFLRVTLVTKGPLQHAVSWLAGEGLKQLPPAQWCAVAGQVLQARHVPAAVKMPLALQWVRVQPRDHANVRFLFRQALPLQQTQAVITACWSVLPILRNKEGRQDCMHLAGPSNRDPQDLQQAAADQGTAWQYDMAWRQDFFFLKVAYGLATLCLAESQHQQARSLVDEILEHDQAHAGAQRLLRVLCSS